MPVYLSNTPKLAWGFKDFGILSATVSITEACPLEQVIAGFLKAGYDINRIYLG